MKSKGNKWTWAQLLGAHQKKEKEEKKIKLNREGGIWKVYENGTLLYASTSFFRAYKYLYDRAERGRITWGCRY